MGSFDRLYLAGALALLLAACDTTTDPTYYVRPEVHGHRGCRALQPENTLPAFEKALDLGCDWLEMDVVITADSQVLVSHEPWMEAIICLTPAGDTLTEDQGRALNIHRMTLAEVQAFDCGSRPHPDFPMQRDKKLSKPTLREVVELIEEKALEQGTSGIGYNIEIKSDPALYGTYQPQPEQFAALVLAEVVDLAIEERTLIQSFDPAILEAVHRTNEFVLTALLVDNDLGVESNLARLTFRPSYYSPAFTLVEKQMVRTLAKAEIGLLVWTVNEKEDMLRMVRAGVDGIITDHPDRLIETLDELE